MMDTPPMGLLGVSACNDVNLFWDGYQSVNTGIVEP